MKRTYKTVQTKILNIKSDPFYTAKGNLRMRSTVSTEHGIFIVRHVWISKILSMKKDDIVKITYFNRRNGNKKILVKYLIDCIKVS